MSSNSKKPNPPILLIDDSKQVLNAYIHQLPKGGINNFVSFGDGESALEYLKAKDASLILLDLKMPGLSGEDTLELIAKDHPHIPVLVITASEETESVVRCMKAGAIDYLVKPVSTTRLITAVNRTLEYSELKRQNECISKSFLNETLKNPDAFSEIITQTPEIKMIFKYIEAIAPSSQPVFITGATGTGKEMMAESVHKSSGRKNRFVAVNVAGLDDNVFSDTLFGHMKGAFTGAASDRSGLVESAAGGTLFLDEIGDLSISSQVKLLRLIQEHEYYPLGADQPKTSNARIVLATNRDIDELKEADNFRKDLYYRICSHHIHIPPLKKRVEDILLLIQAFSNSAASEFGKKPYKIAPVSLRKICTYSFPGNVRELKGLVYDAIGMSNNEEEFVCYLQNKIFSTDKNSALAASTNESLFSENPYRLIDSLPTLEESQMLLIEEALRRSSGNQSAASIMLGTTRQLLHRRLKK
jgi:DNA-binding NtrC family response regulator